MFTVVMCSVVGCVVPLGKPPVVRAAIGQGQVYAGGMRLHEQDAVVFYGRGQWVFVKRAVDGNAPPTILAVHDTPRPDSTILLRWQLAGDTLHLGSHPRNFPAEPHSRAYTFLEYRRVEDLERTEEWRGTPQFRQRVRDMLEGHATHNYMGPQLLSYAGQSDAVKERVYFDFAIHDLARWEVYVYEPHRDYRLIGHNCWFVPDPSGGIGGKTESRELGPWTFDWTGPFYVAAHGDDRFFVTDAGRVYVAPRNAKPGTPLKPVWVGKPVDVLIHDSDAKTWYAFTADQYFPIADPIKPLPHTVPIKRTWKAEEALDTAARCGRVVRGLPEPKGK